MKRLFVETKYVGDLSLPDEVVSKLPKKLVLAMPLQFLNFKEKIVEDLKKEGKEVTLFKGTHDKYPGQILGCDIIKVKVQSGDFDAFLYIGDGKFHPTALLYENKKPVCCYNPFNKHFEVLEQDYLRKLQGRKKGQLVKFLSCKVIGLLVTSKPGQNQLHNISEIRKKLISAGKEVFVFLGDEINLAQMENFNFIDVWVNTACPRIIQDFSCLNLSDLELVGDFSVSKPVFPSVLLKR